MEQLSPLPFPRMSLRFSSPALREASKSTENEIVRPSPARIFPGRGDSRSGGRRFLLDCRLRSTAGWSANKSQLHLSNRRDKHNRVRCRRFACQLQGYESSEYMEDTAIMHYPRQFDDIIFRQSK